MRFKPFYHTCNRTLIESCSNEIVFSQDLKMWQDVCENLVNNYIKEGESQQERLTKKYGITEFEKRTPESCVNSIGYSPKNEKWYGWSHRAIYGFKVGSKCEQGMCHFSPSNKDEFLESLKRWYKDPMYGDVKLTPTKNGVKLEFVIKQKDDAVLTNRIEPYPKKWGKGVWTAKTMDDAKQMAADFARSVS